MSALYNIFGNIIFYDDPEGTERGPRRRAASTHLFVVSGKIKIEFGDGETFMTIGPREEGVIQAGRLHRIVVTKDARYLQKIGKYDTEFDRSE